MNNEELTPPGPLAPGALRVTALGGISEIGRNMTTFEHLGRLLIVDCGVLFPGHDEPGVDLILPDLRHIEDRLDDIEALVLTFLGGALGIVASWLLTVVIPPMPLYSEFYKTTNHEGDIFLKASVGVMAVSFVILSLVGITSGFWPALKASRLEPIEALRYD